MLFLSHSVSLPIHVPSHRQHCFVGLLAVIGLVFCCGLLCFSLLLHCGGTMLIDMTSDLIMLSSIFVNVYKHEQIVV